MLFRRSTPRATPAFEARAAARQAALDRLARYASEDAAHIADMDAARVDARRHAEPNAQWERLAEPGALTRVDRATFQAEIADAVERLGRARLSD